MSKSTFAQRVGDFGHFCVLFVIDEAVWVLYLYLVDRSLSLQASNNRDIVGALCQLAEPYLCLTTWWQHRSDSIVSWSTGNVNIWVIEFGAVGPYTEKHASFGLFGLAATRCCMQLQRYAAIAILCASKYLGLDSIGTQIIHSISKRTSEF